MLLVTESTAQENEIITHCTKMKWKRVRPLSVLFVIYFFVYDFFGGSPVPGELRYRFRLYSGPFIYRSTFGSRLHHPLAATCGQDLCKCKDCSVVVVKRRLLQSFIWYSDLLCSSKWQTQMFMQTWTLCKACLCKYMFASLQVSELTFFSFKIWFWHFIMLIKLFFNPKKYFWNFCT